MGGFSCPICSENLAKYPAEARRNEYAAKDDVNISAAPCGHIFHAYCINKWMHGTLASKNKCPCCRTDIPGLACLPLYPNFLDDSILDDSQMVCDHGELIKSLNNNLAAKKQELEEMNQMYRILGKDYEELQNKHRIEKMGHERWLVKAKMFESYKDQANEIKKQKEQLENQLKTYKEVDMIVKGRMDEIECDRAAYPPTAESIDNLLITKTALTRELKRAQMKFDKDSKAKTKYLEEKNGLYKKIDDLTKEVNEMKSVFANSVCQSDDNMFASPSASSRKQNKVFTKRKGPSPDTSITGEAIDEDVDLIESAVCRKKSSKNLLDNTIVLSSDTDDDFMSPFNFRVKSNQPGLRPITPHHSSKLKRGYSSKTIFPFTKSK